MQQEDMQPSAASHAERTNGERITKAIDVTIRTSQPWTLPYFVVLTAISIGRVSIVGDELSICYSAKEAGALVG